MKSFYIQNHYDTLIKNIIQCNIFYKCSRFSITDQKLTKHTFAYKPSTASMIIHRTSLSAGLITFVQKISSTCIL